jgi:hypothetical protein
MAGASPMSQSVALTAGKPANNSAMAVAGAAKAATDGLGKCMLLFAPLVARTRRYRSSPERDDQCTARTASPVRGGRDKRRAASFCSHQDRFDSALRSHAEENGQAKNMSNSSLDVICCFASDHPFACSVPPVKGGKNGTGKTW